MLTHSTTTMFRSSVVRSCGLQPLLRRAAPTACPYSTLQPSALGLHQSPWKPSPQLLTRKPSAAAAIVPRRHASTSTSTSAAQQDAAAAAAASARATASHADLPPLDWNTFFQLRKTRRRWQTAFSLVTCATGGTVGALFLSTGAGDPVINQIPLDPFVTLGLMTFSFAALGWLAGPVMGNMVFYAVNSKYRAQMTLKEAQFFARVKKNRVDPSASSAGNPVPDFYGEKISSVAGYRQWLKDQRAFNKKRTTFI